MIQKMFSLIKKIFIGLLTVLVNRSNHTKCVSLSSQKCMTQSALINLHPNEYSLGTHTLLDKSFRVLQLPTHLSNLAANG